VLMSLEKTLQAAITHHKAGELEKAEQLYRSILTEESKHPDANHNLGVLLKQGDKADVALPFFKTALESNPSQGQYWISYIDTLIHLEQYDAAQNVLKQGQTKGLKGDIVDQLKERLNLHPEATSKKNPPDPPKTQVDSLIALYSQGQMQKALTTSEDLIQNYPNVPLLYNIGGACYKALGQLEAAVKRFEQALAIQPDYADARYNLGNSLKELGQLEAAVKSYEQALAVKPDYAEAHSNLGLIHHELGQLEAAVKRYEQALAIKPDYAEAYYNLGITLNELGQLEAAVKHYEQALAIKPDCAEVHNNLGNTFQKLGQLDAAVKHYEQALAIKADYSEAQHMIYSLTGQTFQSAPKEYVENLFNNYADKFEDSLVNHLEYAMPSLLQKILLNSNLAVNNISRTIDLGCGTGLCGIEFRDLTETLIGIDLSDKMIAKAKEKNIYDELYVNDLINGLKELESKFDLFISADVFVYVGDLKDLFNTVSECATKHSLFIFSTEDEDGNSFHLRQSGRYAHSKKYIAQLASTSGFKLEHFERSNLRKDKGQWIVAGIYILRHI
jgi:predicted TPR repeat methyltransferase